MIRSLALAVSLLVVSLTHAERPAPSSVEGLYNTCREPEGSLKHFACAMYINGVLDMMLIVGSEPKTHAAKVAGICPKEPVSVAAAVQAFVNWAQQHPEHWSGPRQLGAPTALADTWPCG
jgi:hypothetical protein